MVKGLPKFDALALGELHVDFMKGQIHLEAVAAFVDSHSKSGATHGWTKGTGTMWSKQTMDKLNDLKESMESDLASVHFSSTDTAVRKGNDLGGLSEHLGGDSNADAASV